MSVVDIDPILRRLEANRPAAIARLFEVLRFPSISMDPANDRDCDAAAAWCAKELGSLGFRARVAPTGGHAMVVGHRPSRMPNAPHVLFYGHYDVQPVDPLALWHAPPFEPQLTEHGPNGPMIVARGSSDDKGQFMTFLEACRAWLEATGDIPLDLTVLIEGDEESDSSHLEGFLAANVTELRAGLAMVCDSGTWNRQTPAIITSLRGYAGGEIAVTGPKRDLHSGRFGGAAINPIRALSVILAALHDEGGRVQIPGFYDGIREPTLEQRSRWQRLGFDPVEYLANVGLTTPSGEQGRSLIELIWARPTAEVNGVWGGYQGPGSKTVIPSQAHAKLSFRLVPGQDAKSIMTRFERFARERLMPDCQLKVTAMDASEAIAFDPDADFIATASLALEAEWGVAPALIGAGGSIPIVSAFKSLLGMDSLLTGFSQDDDGAHSPNEKYDLVSFTKGARSWARIIAAIAADPPQATQTIPG